ncbi:LysR family transcriptional regulator [Pseudomonas sp. NPDC090202]|uniref:LysR family transcriptional regulator n=1 Tax=unclassified Pseudomonas TaxID=196821 RepID=UPI0038185FED
MNQLELMRLFVHIAEEGSLSAAARALAVSASTVTLGLQQLEQRVGARLITRTTRRLSLTAEGERLLQDCRRLLQEMDALLDDVAGSGELTGPIRLTTTNDFGRRRIAPLVTGFMAEHPGVQVELFLTDTAMDLVEYGFDVGLRTGPLKDSRLRARLLISGRRTTSAAPAYWERMGRPQHPRELERHNCLVLSRPDAPMRNWKFSDNGAPLVVKISGDRSANDGEILRHWAVDGVGVLSKSDWDIADDVRAGRLETVLDDYAWGDMNLYAVYPDSRQGSRRVAALIEYLVKHL